MYSNDYSTIWFLLPIKPAKASSPIVVSTIPNVMNILVGDWYDKNNNLILRITKEQINGCKIQSYQGFNEYYKQDGSFATGTGYINLIEGSSTRFLEIYWIKENGETVFKVPHTPGVLTMDGYTILRRNWNE